MIGLEQRLIQPPQCLSLTHSGTPHLASAIFHVTAVTYLNLANADRIANRVLDVLALAGFVVLVGLSEHVDRGEELGDIYSHRPW